MKTAHTPGPWRVELGFAHTAPNYHQIVALDGPRWNDPGFSFTACINIHDAKLIAAAPDLLEALKELTSIARHCHEKNDSGYLGSIERAEEVIKLATI